jgi:hypothetical protein
VNFPPAIDLFVLYSLREKCKTIIEIVLMEAVLSNVGANFSEARSSHELSLAADMATHVRRLRVPSIQRIDYGYQVWSREIWIFLVLITVVPWYRVTIAQK